MPEAGAGKGPSTPSLRDVPAPSRRALIGWSAALALPAAPLLAGCGSVAPAKADTAGLPVLVAAITSEQDLVARYEAARSAHAELAWLLDPALAHHREHLAVLRRHYVSGSGNRAGEGGRIPPSAPVAPPGGGPRAVLAGLRQAETSAAARLTAAVAKVDAGLAQVLASIGACEAGHAEALGRAS
ncbi:hypothetical protein [Actinomadura gamaensis]|uniref:Lipoprotein n=1 Tax=Actinomadura gamaensis TaxID=1763541 RepID=A0ABV9TQN8_9ACTN